MSCALNDVIIILEDRACYTATVFNIISSNEVEIVLSYVFLNNTSTLGYLIFITEKIQGKIFSRQPGIKYQLSVVW